MWRVFLALFCWAALPVHAVSPAPDRPLVVAAFSDAARNGESSGRYEVLAAGSRLEARPAMRARAGRTLAVVVDPDPSLRAEVRRRTAEVIASLIRAPLQGVSVRLVFPLGAGFLSPPLNDRSRMAEEVARLLDRYLPDSSGDPPDFAYTLDLIAVLLDRLDAESGAFDGLLIFRDRSFAGEGATYVGAGTERLMGSILTRDASSLHCYVDGKGVLGRTCERQGGRQSTWLESPATVAENLASDSRSAEVVEVPGDQLKGGGAIEIEVLTETGTKLRAPHAVWRHPQGKPVPNHFAMLEGLAWVRRSLEAERAGNMTNMLMSAEAATRQDAWNPDAQAAVGRAMAETGDWENARQRLSLAIELGASDEHVLRAYAEASRRAGRAAGALRLLQPLLASRGVTDPLMALEVARLQTAAGNKEAAAAAYRDLLRQRSDDDTMLAEYGSILLALGNEKDSAGNHRSALALNPRNLRALCFLAEEAARRGERAEAEEFNRRAEEIAPIDPYVKAMQGALAEIRGDWALAVSRYSDALKRDPANIELEDRLVRALDRVGRIDEASRILRHRVEEVPEDEQSWRRLGEFLILTGNLSEGASVFEAGAAALRGNGASLYARAAGLRERLDQSGQALLDYRAMLRAATPHAGSGVNGLSSAHIAALELMSAGPEEARWPASSSATPPPSAPKAALRSEFESMLEIPGGLDTFARVVGIGSTTLRQPDALEQTLFFVMGAPQQPGRQHEQNSIARDITAYLRNYNALIKHLIREQLLPQGFDREHEQTLAFPLVGPADTLRRTAKFLGFFGVNLSLRKNRNGGLTTELALGHGTTRMARQQFLRTLGVNLGDPNTREYRVVVGSAWIPMLGGARLWNDTILAGAPRPKSTYLLERLLADPRATRLYLALSKCSPSAREGLVANAPQGGLLPYADTLFKFGYSLEFHSGKIVFPGQEESWLGLLGLPPGAETRAILQALCRNDVGHALSFYAALSSVPGAVRDFIAVRGRLEKLYQAVASSSPTSAAKANEIAAFSVGRALRGLRADKRGLLVDASEVVQGAYGWSPATQNGNGTRIAVIDEAGLARLMQVDSRGVEHTSHLAFLEFFGYLSRWFPESLSPKTLEAFKRDPVRTRTMLDLVLDLSPPANLLERYLDYCTSLTTDNGPAWNTNRVRSSQSLFHLIALLKRQRAIPADEARQLIGTALECLTPRQESEFSFALSEFLSKQLLPTLRRSNPAIQDPDLILSALAGKLVAEGVRFEGRDLRLDVVEWKLQRMKATIRHQYVLPLDSLLEAYSLLREAAQPDSANAQGLLEKASGLVRRALASSPAEGGSDEAAGHTGLRQALQRASAANGGTQRGSAATIASELAAALHLELGVSLLSYSYAFHGAPEVDVLAFDRRFIRKHEFAPRDRIWSHTSRTTSGTAGLRCTGSIAGLGTELGGLETAQVNQDFGSREGRELLPTMLSGMQAVEPSLRTDRAQEFVAVTVRLGREILATAAQDGSVRFWLEGFLGEGIPPRRRQEILDLVRESRPVAAAGVLSPSELFLLGNRFRESVSAVAARPAIADGERGKQGQLHQSPHLDRLRELVPEGDGEAQRRFWREVEQYGVSLRTRLGISQLSMAISDSFESLEGEFPERLLFERICDLKIRLAELNHALGLPAALGEVQSELALRDILPRENRVRADAWRSVLERISSLGNENVREWLDELVNMGALVPAAQGETVADEAAR